jgi:transcriptional regulator with XRE-family HTH domain
MLKERIDIGGRIKSIRKRKGLTLQDLAEKSSVSATAISAIERNVSSPTVNTLANIGRALGESVSARLGETEVRYVLTRTGERPALATGIHGARFASLGSGLPGQRFVPMISLVPPGATSGEDYVNHPGEEFFFVLHGTLDVETNGDKLVLAEGDSLYLANGTPYRYVNRARDAAEILVVATQ